MLNRNLVNTSISEMFDDHWHLTKKGLGFYHADVFAVDGRVVYGKLDALGIGATPAAVVDTLLVVDVENDSELTDAEARALVAACSGVAPDEEMLQVLRGMFELGVMIRRRMRERESAGRALVAA